MSEQFDFLWNTIRERAKTLVNPISYSTFIENLVPVDVVNKKNSTAGRKRARRKDHYKKPHG